jgi:hypothetical protein
MATFPPQSIQVVQFTKPVLKYTLLDFHNSIAPETVIDITGYEFELVVRKRTGEKVWALDGAIVSATAGSFSFTLTSAHTNLPAGDYDAEIRWWDTPPASRGGPDDAVVVPFILQAGNASWQ